MIDERVQTLIHADLDGELTRAQAAELESALAADPEARAFMLDLRRIADVIESTPPVEPTPGLHSAIRDSLPQPSSAKSSGLFDWLRAAWPAPLAYGGVFAAGAVASVAVLPVTPELTGSGVDIGALSGTMVRYESGQSAAVDRITFGPDEVSGTVELLKRDGLFVIEYDLRSNRPLAVVTEYQGAGSAFRGFAGLGEEQVLPALADGRAVILNIDGRGQYAVFLSDERTGDARIDVRVMDGDTLLHRGSLELPGRGAGD